MIVCITTSCIKNCITMVLDFLHGFIVVCLVVADDFIGVADDFIGVGIDVFLFVFF